MMYMSEEKQNSEIFFQMIALATSGATGRRICISDEIQWQKILCFAQEQGVLPLIGCAMMSDSGIQCPEELREQLLSIVREESAKNLIRRQRTMQLLARMDSLGLNVKILKGYVIADCYQYPECRGSTDIDILISEEQESMAYSFLRDYGFQLTPRGKTEHHAVGLHPKLGKIEVHVQLYNELVTDTWFQNISRVDQLREDPVDIFRNGETYQTLGYTDHLVFLTLHMVKHFIRSEMNVRMMIDVAQFFATYHEAIDVHHYWKILKTLHYDILLRCVLGIMLDTGCFVQTDFPMLSEERPDGIPLVLRDLEDSGYMRTRKKGRILNTYEYTRQMILRNRKPWQYRLYMLKYKLRSAWSQMFPAREQLLILYPFLKRLIFLRPFFRVYRMFAYPIAKIRSGVLKEQIRTDDLPLPPEAQCRMEMFKALDIIP